MQASCHPDKTHLARGMCRTCYNQWYFKTHPEEYKQAGLKWRSNNKEKLRNKALKENFGITLEEFRERLSKQDGLCAICSLEPGTHLDHNHATGKIRGILCNTCNRGLGLFKDNRSVLDNAIRYLKNNE